MNSLAHGNQCHTYTRHAFRHPMEHCTSLMQQVQVLTERYKYHDPSNRLDRGSFRMPYHHNCQNTNILPFHGCNYPCWSILFVGDRHLRQPEKLTTLRHMGTSAKSNHVLSMQAVHLGINGKYIYLFNCDDETEVMKNDVRRNTN